MRPRFAASVRVKWCGSSERSAEVRPRHLTTSGRRHLLLLHLVPAAAPRGLPDHRLVTRSRADREGTATFRRGEGIAGSHRILLVHRKPPAFPTRGNAFLVKIPTTASHETPTRREPTHQKDQVP